MDARYKILFFGEFKSWVERDEFIASFCESLGASTEKAEALLDVEHKVVLKKNLSDLEATRYAKAFEKLGMYVSKRLMMKPFVGPVIQPESLEARNKALEGEDPDIAPHILEQGRKGLSHLSQGIKSIMKRANG